jgi:hypothetical protein
MRHQHIATFEQRTRVVQADAFGLAVGARDCGTRRRGNQGDQMGKRFHGRAIMVCAHQKA